MKHLKPAVAVFSAGALLLGGCAGSMSSLPRASSVQAPPAGRAPGTEPAASPTPATTTVNYTSSPATITIPSVGGYTGTVSLPASGLNGTATMTLTTSLGIPSGMPAPLAQAIRESRVAAPMQAVLSPQLYETLNSTDSVVFNSRPKFTVTLPAAVPVAGLAFFEQFYDPAQSSWSWFGRMGTFNRTVASGGGGAPVQMHGNLNYALALSSFPLSHSPSSFAAPACNTFFSASAVGTIWCAYSNGGPEVNTGAGPSTTTAIEKITPSSAVSIPYSGFNSIMGMHLAHDGNVWFTVSQFGAALGKIDATTNAITTYSLPDPLPNDHIESVSPIAEGGSSLFFLANAQYGTWIATANTQGQVTYHRTSTTLAGSLNFPAVYAGGDLWIVPYPGNGQLETARISSTTGLMTFFPAPLPTACENTGSNTASVPIEGVDKNIYTTFNCQNNGLGYLERITPAGVATLTPVTASGVSIYNVGVTPNGDIWFIDDIGIGESSSGFVTQFANPSSADRPNGIIAMADGNLWALGKLNSTTSGVYVVSSTSP